MSSGACTVMWEPIRSHPVSSDACTLMWEHMRSHNEIKEQTFFLQLMFCAACIIFSLKANNLSDNAICPSTGDLLHESLFQSQVNTIM